MSIAAQKFATSTLMTAPLKVVTIECIEHEVTCLNERVFIKTMNHLLTNCSQSTLLARICRLSLLVLKRRHNRAKSIAGSPCGDPGLESCKNPTAIRRLSTPLSTHPALIWRRSGKFNSQLKFAG